MIGKAKAISHGANLLRYISGDSRRKDSHGDRITRIADNGLDRLDATAMWEMMKLACSGHDRMANKVIRIELSPALENTCNFTAEDWKELWDEYVEEFDRIELKNRKNDVLSPKTNLKGSLHTVWLHEESNSGIPHLHVAVCRVDSNGNTNSDKNIHLRATRAAENVSRRRGWKLAVDIHTERLDDVSEICLQVLRGMTRWDWNDYVQGLKDKGLEVGERRDAKGTLRGYALRQGNLKYKASELGKGRCLTVAKLPGTWSKLHGEHIGTKAPIGKAKDGKVTTSTVSPHATSPKPAVPDYRGYLRFQSGTIPHTVMNGKDALRVFVPEPVLSLYNDMFDYRLTVNCEELIDMAISIFIGLVIPPSDATPSVGGGGGADDRGWGRDPKEDEYEWARRCAQAAMRLVKPRRKSGSRNR